MILPPDSPLRALTDKPALVVFLRSFGCTFCRQAIADVATARSAIEDAGASIVFVHGATEDEAEPWFARSGMRDVARISDPRREHFAAFGLRETGVGALVDPAVWWRGASSALAHGFGWQSPAMVRQLGGAFVVQGGSVLASYRHRSPADRPDYVHLVRRGMEGITMSAL